MGGKGKQVSAPAEQHHYSEFKYETVTYREWTTTTQSNTGSSGNKQGSAGRWYTADGGTKVYVNKDGYEATGQPAYRNYLREGGPKSKGKK